jgi:hypothetical protein
MVIMVITVITVITVILVIRNNVVIKNVMIIMVFITVTLKWVGWFLQVF